MAPPRSGRSPGETETSHCTGALLLLVVLTALAVGPAQAADPPTATEPSNAGAATAPSAESPAAPSPLTIPDRFAGTSILVEHSFTFLHGLNLSPQYTRSFDRTVKLSPSFRITRALTLGVDLGILRSLTVTDTTYPMEILLDDLGVETRVDLPVPQKMAAMLAVSTGLAVDAPTSKASQAESLILAATPWFEFGVTAPLLDGLTLSYRLSPTPRLHRYTTSQVLVPRPCSPASGCTLGTTTNTGQRNTAFQLGNEISLGLALAKERLGISGSFGMTHGFLHAKSPSERWDESSLTVPGNSGGNPVTLATDFIFDISYQLHPGIGLSVGLWTLGGMAPDGSWYNPLANRWSQIYVDITFAPVAMVQAEVQRARNRKKVLDSAERPTP